MTYLAPLSIALPLLVAALLAASSKFLPRLLIDILGVATALAVTVANCLLLHAASASTIVYWFGGWKPRGGLAIGIAFSIDPLSAGLAAFAALLVSTALIFAWRYFDAIGALFHALMLVFLAAMTGFCFSGDLFTLFVFFELMSVVAFALTAYKIEAASIEGGLNFAITNTIGACLTLWGIALLYGRTGALNLAQLQRALAVAPVDSLVVISFLLIASGFLIKAAVVPFHFWLADAHAVAPTPVCVLFSGVMVELGVFGVFRVYWTVFEPVLRPFEGNIRAIFLAVGALTTAVGAIMCFTQRHFKRLLAFSTISHIGMITIGCSTLSARGLAGASLYVLGHGLVKGSLFMTAGLLLQRFGSLDEVELLGRGRELKWVGLIGVIAGLGLAGFPPFGTYLGKELMEEGAKRLSQEWVTWLFVVASALTGAAVLRAMGRIFLGWGKDAANASSPTVAEGRETKTGSDQLPVVMVTMAAVLAIIPVSSGLVPPLGPACQAAAERFVASAGYARAVLEAQPAGAIAPSEEAAPTWSGVLLGTAAAVAAVAIALISLHRDRFPRALRRSGELLVRPILPALHALHSGDIRDYVAWLCLGTAALGGAFWFAVR